MVWNLLDECKIIYEIDEDVGPAKVPKTFETGVVV